MSFVDVLRAGCAEVARRARFVRIADERVAGYAGMIAPLVAAQAASPPDPGAALTTGSSEELTAFWLTMDAINFGSGWFPTLRKRPGRSGYFTIATGVRERFSALGAWSAGELAGITAAEVATITGQDGDHPLMALYAASLNDLGAHVRDDHGGRFTGVVDAANGSAVELARALGRRASFADTSDYDELELPFLKRAQIAAADLEAAGVADFADLGRLTMFADNLVPHVLRIDGILSYDDGLLARIARGELLTHGSPEEVEIRASGVQAVELIARALAGVAPAAIDRALWNRGQRAEMKAVPRHRCRCTAY